MYPPQLMRRAFVLVGPTAVGKSAIGAAAAAALDAEIVNADPFQIYRGLDILTGKPDARTLARVRHHLMGNISVTESMSAVKFRQLAEGALLDIYGRGKAALVVGGSGLYIKALLGGLDDTPGPNPTLRRALSVLNLEQLVSRLTHLNEDLAARTDLKNRRRVSRAIEICLDRNTNTPPVVQPNRSRATDMASAAGVFLVRDRDDLYGRINARVEAMFREGVEDEVRPLETAGQTAACALGLKQVRQLTLGEISKEKCITKIQQATRRYAKRQLTWFRHQTTFPELNLTRLSHQEAISAVTEMARPHFTSG